MTKLSVIVPFYNLAGLVPETLRSIRAAASGNVEFVLIDDCSTDATPELLDEGARSIDNCRVLHNERNLGLAATRNLGIDSTDTDYLTFLDGDDFVTFDYYARLLSTIERLGCEMVRTDHVQVRGRRRAIHRIPHGPRGQVCVPRRAILPVGRATSVDAPHAWAGIYSRRLADRGLLHFDPTLRTCEDRPWIWRLHLAAETFAVVGLSGLFYRREVAGSLTQQSTARQFDFIRAFDQIIAEVSADREAEQLMPKALRAYCAIICHHLRRTEKAAESAGELSGFSYDAKLAKQLRLLCIAALDRLSATELRSVLSTMDEERQYRITELLEAAR